MDARGVLELKREADGFELREIVLKQGGGSAMVFSRLEREGVSVNMHGATRDDGVASSSSGEGDKTSATEGSRNTEDRVAAMLPKHAPNLRERVVDGCAEVNEGIPSYVIIDKLWWDHDEGLARRMGDGGKSRRPPVVERGGCGSRAGSVAGGVCWAWRGEVEAASSSSSRVI